MEQAIPDSSAGPSLHFERTPDTDLRKELKFSDHVQESPEEPRQSHPEHQEFENIIQLASPSPHKQESFRNHEPEQKSRSTKKYAYSGDIGMNLDSEPKNEVEQQPFSVKTQEIQIQENCIDDENEEMKTPQQVISN